MTEDWLVAFARALEPRLDSVASKDDLHRAKHAVARELGAARLPQDPELLPHVSQAAVQSHGHLLRKKPMRSQSGVAIVAVMSSPAACPHGKCVYCPGGPDADAPQSYTGFEPSTMRAKRFGYDPYRVVRSRLGALRRNGHETGKLEIVVQGGTFPAREAAYQDWFIASIYAGCNDGPASVAGAAADADRGGLAPEGGGGLAPERNADLGPELGGDPGAWEALERWEAMDEASRSRRLRALQEANEAAPCRVVGLTIETKPDWCFEEHVDAMLRHGTTRVELGVQTLDDEVTRLTHRGHTVDDARRAMRVARDAGLKICCHLMPGLPRPAGTDADGRATYRVDPAADIEDVRRFFAEEDWRPDMLKIYPTLVVEEGETTLKRWWREDRFEPMDTASAAQVVAEALEHVPESCRIQRIDRDIPTTHVLAGVQNSNLRQLAEAEARRRGVRIREIRAREVGTRLREGREVRPERVVLVRRDQRASGGDEVFLSLEDPVADALVGFLRLRRVGSSHRPEFADPEGAAVVRELKVYGVAQGLGRHDGAEGAWQHQGHGARLLREAERIAWSWGVGRLLVIAGPGVKPYYRHHGYHDLGAYVAKEHP